MTLAERQRFYNLAASIRRRRRRLLNSMAHIARPRPADLERWRVMETEIQALEAEAALMRPDLLGDQSTGE